MQGDLFFPSELYISDNLELLVCPKLLNASVSFIIWLKLSGVFSNIVLTTHKQQILLFSMIQFLLKEFGQCL